MILKVYVGAVELGVLIELIVSESLWAVVIWADKVTVIWLVIELNKHVWGIVALEMVLDKMQEGLVVWIYLGTVMTMLPLTSIPFWSENDNDICPLVYVVIEDTLAVTFVITPAGISTLLNWFPFAVK